MVFKNRFSHHIGLENQTISVEGPSQPILASKSKRLSSRLSILLQIYRTLRVCWASIFIKFNRIEGAGQST